MATYATSQDYVEIDAHIINIRRIDAVLARNLQVFVENLDMEGNLTHQRAAIAIRSLGQIHDWLQLGRAVCQTCGWEGLEDRLGTVGGCKLCPLCQSPDVNIFHYPLPRI